MLQVGFADSLQAVRLNQLNDALKAGSNVDGESFQGRLGLRVEKSDGPLRE